MCSPVDSATAVASASYAWSVECCRALREWSRCLKPGGYLFLSAWQLREKVQLQKILGGLLPIIADMKGPGAPALNTHSDPQPLLAELEALGLDKIACRSVSLSSAAVALQAVS